MNPFYASSLSNEVIIFENLLKRSGTTEYSLSYHSRDGQIITNIYKLHPNGRPLKRFCYPPLAKSHSALSIKYTDSSGEAVGFNIECSNWDIHIEKAEYGSLQGWVKKKRWFCIRPFLILTNGQECAYDIDVNGERPDVSALNSHDNYVGIGISINISGPLCDRDHSVDICYPNDRDVPPTAFVNVKIPAPQHSPPSGKSLPLLKSSHTSAEKFRSKKHRSIAILMPVYDGFYETLGAIKSFSRYFSENLESNSLNVRFILGLDKPDNLALNDAIINEFSWRPEFTIISNDRNLGFVRNCNRLFAETCNHEDIIIVNSDIVAPNSNWIERLTDYLDYDPTIGSVTPFSNQATIYSFPLPNCQQHTINGLSIDEVDEIVSQACNVEEITLVDTPSCHGFCTLIANSRIRLEFLFDEEFGRGYGEENDLSCRLRLAGLRNIAAPNVYIYHHESVSFSAEREFLLKENLRKLAARYPSYHHDVSVFCKLDPLRPLRNKAIISYLRTLASGLAATIHVSHFRGGGTDKYIRDYVMSRPEMLHLGLRPCPDRVGYLELFLHQGRLDKEHEVVALYSSHEAFSLELFAQLDISIDRIIFHSLIDFLPHGNIFSSQLCLQQLYPVEIIVHDYHWISPAHNLLDYKGLYRGPIWAQTIYDINKMLSANSQGMNVVLSESLTEYVARAQVFFESAKNVIFPSQSAKDIIAKAMNLKKIHFTVKSHDNSNQAAEDLPRSLCHLLAPGGCLKVGVIGAIAENKGYELLFALASHIAARSMPIQIVVIGWSMDDAKLLSTGCITITGKYEENEFPILVTQEGVMCTLYLSQWPETYSYTLSLSFENALYPFALDLGAQSERIKATGFGFILESSDPAYIAERLLDFRARLGA